MTPEQFEEIKERLKEIYWTVIIVGCIICFFIGFCHAEIIQVDTANLPPGTTEQFTPFVQIATNTSLTKAKVIAQANQQAETANRAFDVIGRLQVYNLAQQFEMLQMQDALDEAHSPQAFVLQPMAGGYWLMMATDTRR